MKHSHKFVAAICILSTLFCFAIPASANSADNEWSGRDESGVMTTEGDCPLVVEHETLTFDLQEFPEYQLPSEDEITSYTGRLSAEYTFYNPSDMTITSRMAFPVAGYSYFRGYTDYTITANGKTVNAEIRHTLHKWREEFSVETHLPRLKDDYISDSFFTSGDLTVTKYTITLPLAEGESLNGGGKVGIDIPAEDCQNTLFYFDKHTMSCRTLDNGSYRIYSTYRYYIFDTIEFYAIGEELPKMPEVRIYSDSDCNQVIAEGGTIEKSGTYTLNDLVFKDYDESSGISRVDWYNASVTLLQEQRSKGDPRAFFYDFSHPSGTDPKMLVWYCYEVTFAPGERIINKVSAPMYPDVVSIWGDPTRYTYTYLLSPASTWADFGTLDIYINTPYYISNSSLGKFESTDNGYMLQLDGLPKNENGDYEELKFTLISEKILASKPNQTNNVNENVGDDEKNGWIWLVIGGVGGLAVIAAALFVVIRNKKTTKSMDQSTEEKG